MIGTYFAVGLLGLLAFALAGWAVFSAVGERRQERAARRIAAQFQRSDDAVCVGTETAG